jgi:hypothetical protein
MSRSTKKRAALAGGLSGAGLTLCLVVGLWLLASAGSAATTARPKVTTPPTISGTPAVGATLTGDKGNWTNNPTDYNLYWTRCDKTGAHCANISGANATTYVLTSADAGNTLRFKVIASNSSGKTTAVSVPTAVIAGTPAPPPTPVTGCPAGTGTIQIADLKSPARLLIDQQQAEPGVVTRGTPQLIARYKVTACNGRPVQGALVYATAVPFNQLSIPAEAATGADGWAEVDFHMLPGFPVSPHQQLIAIFIRARKSGEDLLGGISGRRLLSVPVHL